MISQGRYTTVSSLTMAPKILVPEIVLRLLEEQANAISKVKLNKIGFRVLVYGFGFKNFISKDEINIHKLIHN